MGFSTIGAGAVLLTAMLLMTHVVTASLLDTEQDHRDGLNDAWSREEHHRLTRIETTNGNHVSGVLHLNLTNTGSTVLDVDHLHVLLDGTWSTGKITSHSIDGTVTDVWAPGEVLWLRIDAAAIPNRAQVVTETGTSTVWTP